MSRLLQVDDEEKSCIIKSRIISLFIRQLSTRLSLAKSQNNKLVHFWKKAIVFISRGNEAVAKRIFASDSSCRRQSLKDEQRKYMLCKKYLNESPFFSVMIDTSLFHNTHFISCMGGFPFSIRLLKYLFFSHSAECHQGSLGVTLVQLVEKQKCKLQ